MLSGLNRVDECLTCDDNFTNNCVQDCTGTWGGAALVDACGTCGGAGVGCLDCAAVLHGKALVDHCDACDTDVHNDCTQDCTGVWGGESVIELRANLTGKASFEGAISEADLIGMFAVMSIGDGIPAQISAERVNVSVDFEQLTLIDVQAPGEVVDYSNVTIDNHSARVAFTAAMAGAIIEAVRGHTVLPCCGLFTWSHESLLCPHSYGIGSRGEARAWLEMTCVPAGQLVSLLQCMPPAPH